LEEKKIIIKITEDGKIFAETFGMKGKQCLEYIQILEELLDAETIDSEFTHEYFETNVVMNQTQRQMIKGE
jgi:myosin-crossreactive antigen